MSDAEPLILTLEEAMVLLAGQDLGLVYRANIEADPLEVWLVVEKTTRVNAGWGMTWMGAASKAFGRPVVARGETAEELDVVRVEAAMHVASARAEAAELRAENERLHAAIREWFDAEKALYIPRNETYDSADPKWEARRKRLGTAFEDLRRLAGEEARE